MVQYKPLKAGDLVSLYPSVLGAPMAFSEPPLNLDDQRDKQVDVSDGMRTLWLVLEWVMPERKQALSSAPSRLGSYVKIMSGKRACWVMEYYLDVVRRAS